MTSLLALGREELDRFVEERGGRAFHGKILRRNVVERGLFDYASMTDLPAALRARLTEDLPVFSSELEAKRTAKDGTRKLLLRFPRGGPEGEDPGLSVETVHIPPHRKEDGDGNPRGATLCVSSQAGCPVGCPFCASGLLGLERNLEAHEILEQFLRGREVGPLRRVVVMGIGEPLLNLANLETALDAVRDEMGIGGRKITVSTVGFPGRLRRLAETKPRFQLAISLHTPFQEQRDELVPAMAGVPIEDVLDAGDHWFETTGREVTYEYVLLGGVNDSPEHADALIRRLGARRCTVNLIPYNPTPELPFGRPAAGEPEAFQERLQAAGLIATVRWSRGLDGAAACGQLRLDAARA